MKADFSNQLVRNAGSVASRLRTREGRRTVSWRWIRRAARAIQRGISRPQEKRRTIVASSSRLIVSSSQSVWSYCAGNKSATRCGLERKPTNLIQRNDKDENLNVLKAMNPAPQRPPQPRSTPEPAEKRTHHFFLSLLWPPTSKTRNVCPSNRNLSSVIPVDLTLVLKIS